MTPSSATSGRLGRAGAWLAAVAAALLGSVAPAFAQTAPTAAVDRCRTPHYEIRVVRGDARPSESRPLAKEVGDRMEEALRRYEALAGVPAGPGAFPVTVHLSRKTYDPVAERYGFPRRITSGLTSYDGAVHVFHRSAGGAEADGTLLHEGFHQYTHRALAYPTPHEVYARFPDYKRPRLPTTPLWLEEGLGTVFETVGAGEGGNSGPPDGYNGPRLRQLQAMIRRNRCPPVRQLMLLRLGDPLTADTYAAMWGLAYDLLRGGQMRAFPLGDFLRRAEGVWEMHPGEALAAALGPARTPEQFDERWNRLIAERCLTRFEEILAANGYTLAAWEEGWKERILMVR